MKIYLASALTHVPSKYFYQYTEDLHRIAEVLKHDLCVQIKYALIDSDPKLIEYNDEDKARLCYEWDKEMVVNSDLIIAESSFPSTGLGTEIQIAEQNNIPVILFYKNFTDNVEAPKHYTNPDKKEHQLQIGNGIISLMLRGNPAVILTIEYKDIESLISTLKNTIIKMPTYNK